MRINKNKLAVAVTLRNKGKRQVPIGQVKEVIKDIGLEFLMLVRKGRAKSSDVLKVFGL